MGCDIHLGVELFDGKQWQRVLPPDDYHADEDRSYLGDGSYLSKWRKKRDHFEWYGDRNYDVFAILADVRNGSGFAGCDTGDKFKVICPPRGLPEDLSDELRARVDPWSEDDDVDEDGDIYLGDHSQSYLSLAALESVSWEKLMTERRGLVDESEYKAWDRKSAPPGYCGGVSGGNVLHVRESEMIERIASSPNDDKRAYCKVSWVETYAESAGRFYTKFLPALRKLAEERGVSTEHVRIVFGFDS